MSFGYGNRWKYAPYVSVASRKAHAAREALALRKKGVALDPVKTEGRTIACSFWGKAWCRNLERYGDFSNRLPRGRSYLSNGLVLDLKVAPGRVTALVRGTELYEIEISVAKLPTARWKAISAECAGKIDSLVELLNGRLSQAVMAVVTRPGTGLFPAPTEIRMKCSCPDSARLCKHLAAALYGVGARLDHKPELLFLLREADHLDLVTAAAEAPVADAVAPDEALAGADLSSIFGIDLEGDAGPAAPAKETRGAGRTVPPKAKPKPEPKPNRKRGPAAPKPAPKAAKAVRPVASTSRRHEPAEVSASELVALGISRATIRNWLTERVLRPTATRGVYGRTNETAGRIEAYLARR